MIWKLITKLMVFLRRRNRKTVKIETMTEKKSVPDKEWIENLKNQLKIDEGYKEYIYLDSEGLATFGIGHLITSKDPEYYEVLKHWPFLLNKTLTAEEKIKKFDESKNKVKVSQERIMDIFQKDVDIAIADTRRIFKDFDNFLPKLKEILVNMCFNLGFVRFSKFKKMIKAVENQDYKKVAKEMVDSKWYGQVGNRAKRLVKRVKSLL